MVAFRDMRIRAIAESPDLSSERKIELLSQVANGNRDLYAATASSPSLPARDRHSPPRGVANVLVRLGARWWHGWRGSI
jgi:hypothetical protein